MLITEMNHEQSLQIENCDKQNITISSQQYSLPVCLTDQMVISVSKMAVTELDTEDFADAIGQRPEVILVGTGRQHLFLAPKLVATLASHGIGLESMNTQAACRTCMILRSEGRSVWAWLWPDE
ncbi:Mth938-like domain-containing protein [Neisseriaceae bacterium ESL0693]|nr:Mth938-like domain-containing protein [Neisseriaceae bacterium ESL0693]